MNDHTGYYPVCLLTTIQYRVIIASMTQEDLDTIRITVKMGQPYFVAYRSNLPQLRPDNIFVIQFYEGTNPTDWYSSDKIVTHIMGSDFKWKPTGGWTMEQMSNFLKTGTHSESANSGDKIVLTLLSHGYTLDSVFQQITASQVDCSISANIS